MDEYFRNLVDNFAPAARLIPRDTRFEKALRLVLSGAVIVVGLYSLNHGYEVAYSDGDHPLLRPDGNGDLYFFDMVGAVAWIISLLGNRLRIWSWAFAIFLIWWAYTATTFYLESRYYVMGQDGCLPCGERAAELHLGSCVFGLTAVLIAAIFRFRQTNVSRIVAGVVVAFVWFFLLAGFA